MAGKKGVSGRKTKLTPEVQKRIVESVRLGAPYCLAAQSGGIGESTLYDWMERGEKGERREQKDIYVEFAKAIKEAESACFNAMLGRIQLAASTSWQAAAWLLERRYPQQFARTMKQQETWNEPAEVVKEKRTRLRAIIGGKAEPDNGNSA